MSQQSRELIDPGVVMADPVEVGPEDVHAAADWLENSAVEFTNDLNALMREVRSFVGG